MKKQRQDSADLYKKGERKELFEAEEAEIKIIDTFLPKQLNEEETKKVCKEVIEALGASSIKDMGKIMGSLKEKYSDSIDFSKVNIKTVAKSSVLTSGLVVLLGIVGSISPLFNLYNFLFFGQNQGL